MEGEEGVEKLVVRETTVIEGDLDYFRVAGAVGTDFFVGRVFEVAACVSYGCIDNTIEFVEAGFNTPKTSCSKYCFFKCHVGAPLQFIGCAEFEFVILRTVNCGSILGFDVEGCQGGVSQKL